jgi:hypothetical protein
MLHELVPSIISSLILTVDWLRYQLERSSTIIKTHYNMVFRNKIHLHEQLTITVTRGATPYFHEIYTTA